MWTVSMKDNKCWTTRTRYRLGLEFYVSWVFNVPYLAQYFSFIIFMKSHQKSRKVLENPGNLKVVNVQYSKVQILWEATKYE